MKTSNVSPLTIFLCLVVLSFLMILSVSRSNFILPDGAVGVLSRVILLFFTVFVGYFIWIALVVVSND